MDKIEKNGEKSIEIYEKEQEKHLEEQDRVLANNKKNMLVSASAGSGKTFVMIKYICELVVKKHVPISAFLVLTFTKSAAAQMKDKLLKRLKERGETATGVEAEYIIEQIDALSTANICTIDAFCERAIKKYASTLGISESFSVLDESQAKSLKELAFRTSLKKFAEQKPYEFDIVVSTYKNREEKIWEIVQNLENIANSVADKDLFLHEIGENFEEKFDNASKFLLHDFLFSTAKNLEEIEALHVDEYFGEMRKTLAEALASTSLVQLFSNLQNIRKLPNRPSQKIVGDETFEKIGEIKDLILEKISNIKNLNLSDQDNLRMQKNGELEKAVLALFDLYEKSYDGLKEAQNCMDFADLEKNMRILSQNEKLFEGFEYVFVDEYQDTNKIQEEIVKNIAKNCNFVAVGDLKQGIYGFRLASSEIFLKDLKDFEQDENSAVNYLKSNFRSSQKVLDFVNDIFQVCMTEEIANVDYVSTSMLKSENDFVEEEEKAVNIDIIAKKEPVFDEIPKIYSVKNAKIASENGNQTILQDIKRRINEVVGSKISDGGSLRQANFGDIAILARGRDGLFEQLESFLQENDIPVISNSRSKLAKEPEIQMLINYLRLSLALDDEIALLSVLLSGLYLLDVQTIFDEKISTGKNLIQLVSDNESGYYSKFLKNLQEFRTNCAVFGAKKAFSILFSQTNYLSYIALRKDHEKIEMFVEKFLSEVEKYDFDIPALIHFFDTVDVVVTPEATSFGDCVTLTTIHDSKGLEYPIVFLIGCDKDFVSSQSADVQINEKFGLALKVFDLENNSAVPSVRLLAIKEDERQKDFVEGLMIFYVALTRAKNRLYLFGEYDPKCFEKHDVKSCRSYFDLIFFAHKDAKESFCASAKFESENLSVNFIESVEEILPKIEQNFEEAEFDKEIVKKIKNYVDFSYKFGESKNFRLKESVTGLTKKLDEDGLSKFSNENFNFGGNAVEIGNAYHLALKVLDFDKVEDLPSLKKELEKFKGEINLSLIDFETLLKNIFILKPFTKDEKVFKEKEFLLKEKIGALIEDDVDDEILVQGIVDLFVIKNDEIVLIDYKYSSKNSDEYLINKYKNQLKLYKIAIENAFKIPVSQCFLLSLKFGKIIPINV